MITYQREHQQTIPDSKVIIVGIGGAGANVIDRVALDGMENAQQLALNTDSRTLSRTVAKQKVQMGVKLTRGLGCGGDPELGMQAAMEVEDDIRDALRGHKMVFVCVGLGGGTGSGSAPLVTRIARELGAFVVVFSTMPFSFEGRRRREQAETSLNELSVLANALVTFDNGRMGELVLASQGIHDAFAAADNMISESIRAVTRLVIKPGLVNVGLDDLMSALRATRSRCLFGSGIATGENRSHTALKNALNSPLLDKGRLLKNTQTALVHVCGGGEMTLYEVELLMRELSKTVPEDAHILFGAAVDETMGDSLSVTIISSLPEEHVLVNEAAEIEAAKKAVKPKAKKVASKPAQSTPSVKVAVAAPKKQEKPAELAPKVEVKHVVEEQIPEEELEPFAEQAEVEVEEPAIQAAAEPADEVHVVSEPEDSEEFEEPVVAEEPEEELVEEVADIERKVEPEVKSKRKGIFSSRAERELDAEEELIPAEPELVVEPPAEVEQVEEEVEEEIIEPEPQVKVVDEEPAPQVEKPVVEEAARVRVRKPAAPVQQGELLLDGGPRGKFEGEAPNMVDGEDLDIPPFLRNRR